MKKNPVTQLETKDIKLQSALVDYVYHQAYAGLVSIVVCATAIFIGIYSVSDKPALIAWFAIFLIVTLLRCILVIRYNNKPIADSEKYKWRNWFTVTTAVSGALWGIMGSLLLPSQAGLPQLLVILIMAGITAGAVPLFSAILSCALIFFVLALFPPIIHFGLLPNKEYILLACTIALYLGFLIFLSTKLNALIVRNIRLAHENDELLRNLLMTQNELEIINKQLETAATHDGLTRLPNRTFFLFSLDNAIKRAARNKDYIGLLYFDLDGFKAVNDNFGHAVGDKLLVEIAQRVKRRMRSGDFLARLGGDEFAMFLENIKTPAEGEAIAEMVCDLVKEPFFVDNKLVQVSASVGVSFYPIDGQTPETLIEKADQAMYYIKRKGSSSYYCVRDMK